MVLKQFSVVLDHEDVQKARKRGLNVSKLCRECLKRILKKGDKNARRN